MKPLEDSPLDHINIDHDRSSFLNGSEADREEFADLPPPPRIDSIDNPYPEYPEDNRSPTPPPSPGVSPFYPPPRASTPENGTATWFRDYFVSLKYYIFLTKPLNC